jgi:hypothetical protein
MISSFAVLPANGWIHCCGESKSVELVEDENAAVVVDVAEPKPDDISTVLVDASTDIVGFFFAESNFLVTIDDKSGSICVRIGTVKVREAGVLE